MLVAINKIKFHSKHNRGSIPISGKPGKYTFVWDNSISRWTSKDVIYTVSIRSDPSNEVGFSSSSKT